MRMAMMITKRSLFRLVVFLFLFSSSCSLEVVDVGVILDSGSWIGNISWSCMPMALDDFYASHSNYTTRLSLHLRESGETAFQAATAAVDLLKNVKVQAIIGPQRSAQAKFIIELGDRAHVPIISFSAKSPSLSSEKSPYFIRTAFNDPSQAKVITSIVQAYKWREVVPVFEDSEYGNGIIPYLVDAIQEVQAQVPYRSSISLSATKDEIVAELHKLKKMRTRVFVVHMTYSLGLQLFSNAKEAGMMGEGYVWITTYGLTDLVDLNPNAANVMQGVLGIKPYIRETDKLRDFKVRWKNRSYKENFNAEVTAPTVFGLWAYDTVWSLALAAEGVGSINSTFQELNATNGSTDLARLGSSTVGPILRSHILNIQIDGMSGEFYLSNGQLEPKAFEIINVVGHGKRRVGFWTPAYNISRHLNRKADLKVIIWPGDTKTVPKGWEWPINGTKLKIGIPAKPGFEGFVRWEKDPRTNKSSAKGYCIEVFDAVMKEVPYPVPYEYVPYEDGTYDDLVYAVYLQNYDAVVGDVTIIANRSLYVDFSLPYTESGVSMLVPIKDRRHKSAWTFLKPLTTDLWLSSGTAFVFTGFVVWFLEHRFNNDFRGTRSNQIGTVFYFAFSTLVFAHREKVVSNLSRIVVIIWVFMVLILQSSYTASLTSLLTVQQLQPTVTDLADLIKTGASVGYADASFMLGLLKRLNFKESKLIAFESLEEYNEALSNGSVAAIVDEIPYLKLFLSKHCNNYTTVGPTYKTDGFGFVFPIGSPLAPDVSRAILNLTEGDKMINIENKLYGNSSCPDPGVNSETSSSLSFNSFWGLFLITGIASFLVLILGPSFFLYANRNFLSSHTFCQWLALLKLYYQMEPDDPPGKTEEANEGKVTAGDVMKSPYLISGPRTSSSVSSLALESFDPEDEVGMPSEEEGSPGREISRESPDPPSFAEMLMRGTDGGSS